MLASAGLVRGRVVVFGLATLALVLYLVLASSFSSSSSTNPSSSLSHALASAAPCEPATEHLLQKLADLADSVAALEKDIHDKSNADQRLREAVAQLVQKANDQEEKKEKEKKPLPTTVVAFKGEKVGGKNAEGDDDVAMPPECEAMWLSDVDKKTFVRGLTSRKVQQYIEWGGGGSTLCSSRLVPNVTTIEHNEAWCKSLREQLQAKNVTNVNLICSPVAWQSFGSTPEGDGTYEQFRDYVDTIDTLGISHFDAVFIDGRARVACARKALGYISSDSLVMVHDWQRAHYSAITEWYDVVNKPYYEQRDVLALLRKKL